MENAPARSSLGSYVAVCQRVTPAAGAGVDGVVDGVVRVEIAGLARTDRAGWSSEFTEIADTILGAGGDRTKSPSSTADDFDEPDL